MSLLAPCDDDMHYHDGSHRWIAPPGIRQAEWDSRLHAHKAAHLATMGGPARAPHRPGRAVLPPRDAA